MMKIQIESIENGYIISYYEDEEDANGNLVKEEKREVFEELDVFEGENETMVRLLTRVADFFGVTYDKYKENNLNITFDKKGHKL